MVLTFVLFFGAGNSWIVQDFFQARAQSASISLQKMGSRLLLLDKVIQIADSGSTRHLSESACAKSRLFAYMAKLEEAGEVW